MIHFACYTHIYCMLVLLLKWWYASERKEIILQLQIRCFLQNIFCCCCCCWPTTKHTFARARLSHIPSYEGEMRLFQSSSYACVLIVCYFSRERIPFASYTFFFGLFVYFPFDIRPSDICKVNASFTHSASHQHIVLGSKNWRQQHGSTPHFFQRWLWRLFLFN